MGKRPFVTKHCFRNTAHLTILKAIVHHPLDTLCLASLYICCPFPALLLASLSQYECYCLFKFSLWVNWSTRNIEWISWSPKLSLDIKLQSSVRLFSPVLSLFLPKNSLSKQQQSVPATHHQESVSTVYLAWWCITLSRNKKLNDKETTTLLWPLDQLKHFWYFITNLHLYIRMKTDSKHQVRKAQTLELDVIVTYQHNGINNSKHSAGL